MSDTPALTYRRQHPLGLLFGMARQLRDVVLGLLPLALLNAKELAGSGDLLQMFAVVLIPLVIVGAGLGWAMQRFAIGPDALILRSGVLFREVRTIPFARIQGVSTVQSPVQRVLGLGALRVDTGGHGRGAEAELPMLRWADVLALQEELILRRRAATGPAHPEASADAPPVATPPAAPDTVLATIADRELLLAGATSTQLLVALGTIAGFVDRAGGWSRMPILGPMLQRFEARMSGSAAVDGWVIAAAILAGLAGLTVLWGIGVLLTWARFRGFTLRRVGDTLVRTFGWLSRESAITPLRRIQALTFRETPLRRLVRRGELRALSAGALTASASSGRPDVPTLLPILRIADVAAAVAHVYPDVRVDWLSETPHPDWQRPSRRTWARTGAAWTVRAVFVLLPVSLLFGPTAWHALWGLPIVWACTPLAWRVRGVARDGDRLIVREGSLGRETWVMPLAKVQLVHLRQGPWQRAIGTASVRITTAGVKSIADVVDLPEAAARALVQDLSGWLVTHARRAPVA